MGQLETPDRVLSLDGKSRPARRPQVLAHGAILALSELFTNAVIQRRNLTKGQQAMVAARAASVSKATKASARFARPS